MGKHGKASRIDYKTNIGIPKYYGVLDNKLHLVTNRDGSPTVYVSVAQARRRAGRDGLTRIVEISIKPYTQKIGMMRSSKAGKVISREERCEYDEK